MGLLSGFKAKLKSKHKKSPDIVCVNYKINNSFDNPGSSYTYRTTAIWNNSPKSTEKNKTSIRSPTIKRTSSSSATSETGKKDIHNTNNVSPSAIQAKDGKIKRLNTDIKEEIYKNNEDTNRIIRTEAEEIPYTDNDYVHSNHSDHCQEADENIKSVLIFMTEDHDSRRLYDSDKNNNEYSENTGTEDNNVVILTSHNNSSQETNSGESILRGSNETEDVQLREDTFGQVSETGKSVRFAEENSYHSITPTIIRSYYFEPTDDENEYEVKHVDLSNLSLGELEEKEDDEEEEIDENDTSIQNITQHNSYSLHYYNGMAFSSQASNIFFGGEDFVIEEEEEKNEKDTSRASSSCA